VRKKLAENKFPKYLTLLAKRVEESGSGYVAGSKLSVADLKLSSVVGALLSGRIDGIATSYLDAWPDLLAHNKKVTADVEARTK
jgi:glutathione S-transferase